MNLVVNARDAMPHGGQLTIETANVELDATYSHAHPEVRPGPYVALVVSDTGVGMDDVVLSHLFEPFFTTKGADKGTGLGLATVYGIVKQSGGHISTHSKPGQGTTFTIYLPRVDAELKSSEWASASEALPKGTETVLLVEDDDIVRELAFRVLVEQGYTVLAEGHPEDALRFSVQCNDPIDLLLTDVVMPGIGGRELAERLAPSRPEMRVLYVSGYTDDAIVHHGVLEPGIALLKKPFTPRSLTHMVRDVLDQ
jgi:CheY-like chemotaxis protein